MEERDLFRFQEFHIDQTNAPFKVGTDAVLLAAWVQHRKYNSILEPGSGTGVISIITAGRFLPSHLQTLELNPIASSLTIRNSSQIINSTNVEHFEGDWMNFVENTNRHFDLIISNPPYFENSFLNNDLAKRAARHAENLSLKSLLSHAGKVAKEKSVLAVVIPFEQVDQYSELAKSNNWHIARLAKVRNRPSSRIKRALVEYAQIPQSNPQTELITLRNQDNTYSEQYLSIVKGLYLFS
jgi:tRNA1Val (adenine37-N6)-methyltransferase